ncbi:hypothetical protein [Virgibacillus sp. YIM 98842]|jgi:uncharacterized membrane protein|uniref:hypothetical protein n=1 Tax=Virgibacillus sp. YIM 98842 TaxID=2663533 RepID=UPI0013DAF24C|nr:hypothetical protein [Virgibacillus sp. YIM 98842]
MRELLLVVHIFLAIIWAGGIMFIGWGVFPATLKLSLARQRYFLISLMKNTHYLFTLAGTFVIFTGILLGTVFGPIKTWGFLWHTTYGNIFIAALIIGLITLLWGMLVGYREMMIIFKDEFLWKEAEKGNKKPLIGQLIRLAALESVEVVGFVALVFLMVAF